MARRRLLLGGVGLALAGAAHGQGLHRPRAAIAPGGRRLAIAAGDGLATVNAKIAALQPGDTALFAAGRYALGGPIVAGPGVTLWADGPVMLVDGDIDGSGRAGWTVAGRAPGDGFVLQGGRIDAAGASGGWRIANTTFSSSRLRRGGFAGSAIHLDGASDGAVLNCDFAGCAGTAVGTHDPNRIAFDGLHFADCQQPFSIQVPPNADRRYGNGLAWRRCVFTGTRRAAIEVGPTDRPAPGEFFDGTVVADCFFDAFRRPGGPPGDGQLLAISLVGAAAQNTTITGNFIRLGTGNAGWTWPAIELGGSGEVTGNTIVDASYGAILYRGGGRCAGNARFNGPANPWRGWLDFDDGQAAWIGANADLAAPPETPAWPARIAV